MTATTWRKRWSNWARTEKGKRWINLARVLFIVGIVAILVYELTGIGWRNVLAALPDTPWFYLLWLGIYLVLPIADTFTYRILWGIPFWKSLPVFFRKKVYGTDVMNYSGEVYVFFWARGQLDKPSRDLAKDVRDNTIVSSATSTLISIVVLTTFLLTGQLKVGRLVDEGTMMYVIPGILLGILLVALGIRFRRYLFGLSAATSAKLMGVHGARIISVLSLQVAQWVVVLPEIPMKVWFSFLAVQIVINAIPVVPSKDLIFLGLGVGMAETLGAPEAAIAGILLTKSVLDKLTNLVLFILTSVKKPVVTEDEEAPKTLEVNLQDGTHPGGEQPARSKQHTAL